MKFSVKVISTLLIISFLWQEIVWANTSGFYSLRPMAMKERDNHASMKGASSDSSIDETTSTVTTYGVSGEVISRRKFLGLGLVAALGLGQVGLGGQQIKPLQTNPSYEDLVNQVITDKETIKGPLTVAESIAADIAEDKETQQDMVNLLHGYTGAYNAGLLDLAFVRIENSWDILDRQQTVIMRGQQLGKRFEFTEGLLYHGGADLDKVLLVNRAEGELFFTRVGHEWAIGFFTKRSKSPAIFVLDTKYFNSLQKIKHAEFIGIDKTRPGLRHFDPYPKSSFFSLDEVKEIWVSEETFDRYKKIANAAKPSDLAPEDRPLMAVQAKLRTLLENGKIKKIPGLRHTELPCGTKGERIISYATVHGIVGKYMENRDLFQYIPFFKIEGEDDPFADIDRNALTSSALSYRRYLRDEIVRREVSYELWNKWSTKWSTIAMVVLSVVGAVLFFLVYRIMGRKLAEEDKAAAIKSDLKGAILQEDSLHPPALDSADTETKVSLGMVRNEPSDIEPPAAEPPATPLAEPIKATDATLSSVLRPVAYDERNLEDMVRGLIAQLENDRNEFRRAAAARDLGNLPELRDRAPFKDALFLVNDAIAALTGRLIDFDEKNVVKRECAVAIGELGLKGPLGLDEESAFSNEQRLVLVLAGEDISRAVKIEVVKAIGKMKYPTSKFHSEAPLTLLCFMGEQRKEDGEMQVLVIRTLAHLESLQPVFDLYSPYDAFFSVIYQISESASYWIPTSPPPAIHHATLEARQEAITQVAEIFEREANSLCQQATTAKMVNTPLFDKIEKTYNGCYKTFDHILDKTEEGYCDDVSVRLKTAQALRRVVRSWLKVLSETAVFSSQEDAEKRMSHALVKDLIANKIGSFVYGNKAQRRAPENNPDVQIILLQMLAEFGKAYAVNSGALVSFVFSDDSRVCEEAARTILTINNPFTVRRLVAIRDGMKKGENGVSGVLDRVFGEFPAIVQHARKFNIEESTKAVLASI